MLKLRSESFKRKKKQLPTSPGTFFDFRDIFYWSCISFFLQSLWQVISILTFSEGPQEVFWNPGFPFNWIGARFAIESIIRARWDAKITLGITGLCLYEILGRDYGFKEPYWRPSFTFLLVMLSGSLVQQPGGSLSNLTPADNPWSMHAQTFFAIEINAQVV